MTPFGISYDIIEGMYAEPERWLITGDLFRKQLLALTTLANAGRILASLPMDGNQLFYLIPERTAQFSASTRTRAGVLLSSPESSWLEHGYIIQFPAPERVRYRDVPSRAELAALLVQ